MSDLTRDERALRRWLLALTILFAAQALIYVPQVWSGSADARPFAINSFAKDLIFAALTGIAAADVRRFSRLIGLVVAGHLAIIALLVVVLASGRYDANLLPPEWQGHSSGPWPLAGWLAGALAITVLLIWLYRRALRARYGLKSLWPIEHDTLTAVADAILDRPAIPPREIAAAVDAYWATLQIRAKGRLRGALFVVCLAPLLRLNAPLPLMDRPRRRQFIEHLLAEISSRSDLRRLRRLLQASIRFSMQMVYVGYYGDERSHPATGYVKYSERPRQPDEPPPHRRLRTSPADGGLEAEVVIVGSGAGGSMAAHALAARGRDVVILERGPHVDRSEFSEDEPEMYARLYSDGALQLSRDFSVQVLQGMCVGGSTVVNNGVSFNLPHPVLDEWNERYKAGLDAAALTESFDLVRSLISVQRQHGTRGNPIADRVSLEPVEANLRDCLGCGNCNIGCRYGRKLSMLDKVLPDAQRLEPGRVRIVADCEAERILVNGGRATGVRCRLRSGRWRDRRVDIKSSDAVVVAAGAIHASLLLMRSRIGGDRVGRRLCANLGSHLTAYFGDGPPLNAFDGLQMSHYAGNGHAGGHVIETWFNPVMSQALVMPGWLGDHQTNMERYDRLSSLGVLVGSEARDENRVLKRPALLNAAQVDIAPSRADLDRLLTGLRRAGELLLESGATCVMPATFRYWELGSGDLERLSRDRGGIVQDASDISVNTGHPQGGNPMSRDPELGVVDEHFRVHGFENLHVCDASVFPTAITVNPQLTVMALAHLAGSRYIG